MGQKQVKPLQTNINRQFCREEELHSHMIVQRIENFMLLSFMVGNKKHSLSLILSCYQSRVKFEDFVMKEKKFYDVKLWCEVIRILSLQYSAMFTNANRLYDEYFGNNINENIKLLTVSNNSKDKIFHALNTLNLIDLRIALNYLSDEIINNLSIALWAKFVESKYYSSW